MHLQAYCFDTKKVHKRIIQGSLNYTEFDQRLYPAYPYFRQGSGFILFSKYIIGP